MSSTTLALDPAVGQLLERLQQAEHRIADLEKRLTDTQADMPKQAVTIVLCSNEFDKVMPAFIIASGAVSMGMEAQIFCTFWGLSVLRVKAGYSDKSFAQKMMSFMLPSDPNDLKLTKMHMFGMGMKMMKGMMASQNVTSLPDLMRLSQEMGVQLTACQMSMGLMGITREELMPGVDYAGVAAYLENASKSRVTLFI